MKFSRTWGKRTVSLLLLILMVLGTVPVSIFTAFAVDGDVQVQSNTEAEAQDKPTYASLYVQNGLTYLWTAEGLTPGESVSSLPNYVDDGATAIDNMVLSLAQHNGHDYDAAPGGTPTSATSISTNRVVSADGKAVVGHGAYKYDLTKFFPNVGKNGTDEASRDGDWTYEALITNVKYGADADNNATNHLLWALTTSGKNFAEGNNFAWIDFYTGVGNKFVELSGYSYLGGATLGAALSEVIGVPYTLTLASNRPSYVSEGNANWSAIYMYRDGDASTVAAGAHNYVPDVNGARDGYRSFYFGPGYEEEAYSSIRLYNKKLSDAELAQNHFIDVAYMLDLDLLAYSKASQNAKKSIHSLTVGKLSTEIDKNQLVADINDILAADSMYYSLYVQNGLVYLWTAEGATPSATVSSLPNFVDGGATAIDSLMRGDSYVVSSVFNDPNDAMTNMAISADGKSVVGDGFWKLDLTKFFPNAGDASGRDGDVTLEVLQTNLAYGNRTEAGGWTNRKLYLLWAVMTYHTDVGNANGTNFSYIAAHNQNGEAFGGVDASTLGPMLSEALNVPHTISMSTCRPALASGNENWSTWSFYRDGDITGGVTGGHNYVPGQDRNAGYEGARSLGYGIGYEKEAYSAIRLYNHVLSDAEMAQNHFVDVAFMLEADLTEYRKASDDMKAKIHALTVGKTASDFTKEGFEAAIESEIVKQSYSSLYVQDGLTYFWLAGGLEAGASVASLPNFVDGGATAIDSLIRGDSHLVGNLAFGEVVDGASNTAKAVTADGKAVAGDGFWKLDLTKFVPTTNGNYDDPVMLEVLQTNLSYGNRTEAGGHVNRKMLLLFATLTYHLDVGNKNYASNMSYVGLMSNAGSLSNAYMTSKLGSMFSEDLNVPFTISFKFRNGGSTNMNGTVYHRLDIYRDGYVPEDNRGAQFDANYTGGIDMNGDRAGNRTLNYGIGYESEAYSSIRLYNRLLTDEEMAQNHFVDVAFMLEADLTEYRKASDDMKAKIHALTVGKTAADFTKESLEKAIAHQILTGEILAFDGIGEFLTYDGVQARLDDYAAVRLLYTLDKEKITTLGSADYAFGLLYGSTEKLADTSAMTVAMNVSDGTLTQTGEGYENVVFCQNGTYNDQIDFLNKDGKIIYGVTLNSVERSQFATDSALLSEEYYARAYFACRKGGETFVVYLDFDNALFGNSISIARANEHFLCNGYAYSDIIAELADEDMLTAALAAQEALRSVKNEVQDFANAVGIAGGASQQALNAYADYIVAVKKIDSAVDVLLTGGDYATAKKQFDLYYALACEAYALCTAEQKAAIQTLLDTRYNAAYDALVAKGVEQAEAEQIAATVVSRVENLFKDAVEASDDLNGTATLDTYAQNVAGSSATVENTVLNGMTVDKTLTFGNKAVANYVIIADDIGMTAAKTLQEIFLVRFGAFVAILDAQDAESLEGKQNVIYIGMTHRKILAADNAYALYFNGAALCVEGHTAGALLAGVTDLVHTYSNANGDVAVPLTAELQGTYKPFFDTNAPVGTLDRISIDLDTQYNATGVWECFSQIMATLPEEITVLDRYSLDDYGALNTTANTFFVATDGDDATGDGTIGNPFATVNRALQEVEYRKGGAIMIRGGTYALDSAITIDAKHSGTKTSPLFISAYNGEEVVFIAGDTIKSNQFVQASTATFVPQSDLANLNKFTANNANNVYVADLEALGFDRSVYEGKAFYEINVTIDDLGGHVARFPNVGENNASLGIVDGQVKSFTSDSDIIDVGYVDNPNSGQYEANKDKDYGFRIYIHNTTYHDRVTQYDSYNDETNPDGRRLTVYGSFFQEWYRQRHGIQIKTKNGHAYMSADKGLNVGVAYSSGNTCFFENMLEDLDDVGEFIFDDVNMLLYVYAPGGVKKNVAISAREIPSITVNGASQVVLNGISIKYNKGNGIEVKNSENVILQNMSFEILKATPFILSECKESAVIYSTFRDCGMSYVVSNLSGLEAKGNLVQNNFFDNWSEDGLATGSNALYMGGVGDVYSHNYFYNVGVALQGYENLVEYNEFVGGGQTQKDNGPIYGGSRGSHIRGNLFVDLNYSLYGIYMDDTTSGNYIYNNIIAYSEDIEDGAKCINLHSSSMFVVMNNICIGGTRAGILNPTNYYPMYVDNVSAGGGFVGSGFELVLKNNYLSEYNAFDKNAVMSRFPIYNKHYNDYVLEAYDVMMNDPGRNADGQHMRSEEDAAEIHVRLPKFNVYKENVFFNCGTYPGRDAYAALGNEADKTTGHGIPLDDLVIYENNSENYSLNSAVIVSDGNGGYAWSAGALALHPALADVDLNHAGIVD